jgi:hypothetical protein
MLYSSGGPGGDGPPDAYDQDPHVSCISHQLRAIDSGARCSPPESATNLRVPHNPGFLLSLLGSAKFMRLSL